MALFDITLFEMSTFGSILIFSIIILRKITRYRVSHKLYLIMWWVTMIRLLMPITFPVNSQVNLSEIYDNVKGGIEKEIIQNPVALNVTSDSILLTEITKNMTEVSIWNLIWILGIALIAIFFIVTYYMNYRRMQTSLPLENKFLIQLKKEYDLENVTLYVSDLIDTPLTYGIFHSKIVFSKNVNWDDFEQLRYIMIHESMHIKRKDNLWKIVLLIVVTIHWFNPFVWMMYFLFNQDLEISCDETVLRTIGTENKEQYAMALINLAENKRVPMFSAFGKNPIKERIRIIMKSKNKKVVTMIGIMVLFSVTAVAFASSKTNSSDISEDSKESTYIDSDIIEAYQELGLEINKNNHCWIYNGKDVQILFDEEEKVSLNEAIPDEDAAYIVIKQNNGKLYIESIGKEVMLKLLDEANVYSDKSDSTETALGLRNSSNISVKEEASTQSSDIMIEAFITSTEFKDYMNFGISYDNVTDALYYNDKRIGFFRDEFEEDTYNRTTFDGGEIDIKVIRNSEYEIVSIEEVDGDLYRNNDAPTFEK